MIYWIKTYQNMELRFSDKCQLSFQEYKFMRISYQKTSFIE